MNKHGVAYAIVGILSLVLAAPAQAGVVVFTDIDEFRAAAGPLVEIDFTVLPDGSPAPLDVPFDVTPGFNYTDWGVTFSSPVPDLRMGASSLGGGGLSAVSHKSSVRTWIEAEFEPPVYAIGVTTLATLSVFDVSGEGLAGSPSAGFIGFVSDTPIDSAIVDRGTNAASMSSLLFQPVPEPGTLLLLGAGVLVVARRRRGHYAVRGKRRLAHGAAAGVALLVFGQSSQAGLVVFTDIDEFRAAAGPLVDLDFGIAPDGSPAPQITPIEITPEFNYTDFGVTFSSPEPELLLLGHAEGGGSLLAVSKSSVRNWIQVEFEPAVYAVGFTDGAVFGPFLSVLDSGGSLLAEARSFDGFVGMISNVPIQLAIIDENSNGAGITSMLFQPIPEPATLLLSGAGVLVVARRRGRHSAVGGKRRLAHGAAAGVALLVFGQSSQAGVVVFTDIDEFRAAAGPLVEIDFGIAPDGSPSPQITPIGITPEFNYTHLGVTFSSPEPELLLLGHTEGGGSLLAASKSSVRNWIEAEFDPHVYAVAITTGGAVLSLFDETGGGLVEATSSPGFVGIVSDTPVQSAMIDAGSNAVSISSLLYQPVPEPASSLLLGAGLFLVARRRRAQS